MRGEWAKASISALDLPRRGLPARRSRRRWPPACPSPATTAPSGPREIIQHEVNGLLVSPESIAGMAAALLRLATDDDLRRALGEGAYRTSRQYDAYVDRRALGRDLRGRARPAYDGRTAARPASPPWSQARPKPTPADLAVPADGVTPAQAREEALGWAVRAATASARPLAGDPGARVGRTRRGGADGRPRRVPQGARPTPAPRRTCPCATRSSTAGPNVAAPSPPSARSCAAA